MDTIDLLNQATGANVLMVAMAKAEPMTVIGHDVPFAGLPDGWYMVRPDILACPPVIKPDTQLIWRGVETGPMQAALVWRHDIQSGHGDKIVLVSKGAIHDIEDADELHDAVMKYFDITQGDGDDDQTDHQPQGCTAGVMVHGDDFVGSEDGPTELIGKLFTFVSRADFQPDLMEPDIILMMAEVIVDGEHKQVPFSYGDFVWLADAFDTCPVCETLQRITESGSGPGFAGSVSWTNFACGHQDFDGSGDTLDHAI